MNWLKKLIPLVVVDLFWNSTKKLDLENKIPHIVGIVKKQIKRLLEDKIPSITCLANTAALNAFENKIPNVSDLVKKKEYDAKISDIEKKCFTTCDYSTFMSRILDAKIKEKDLVNTFNKKIATVVAKAELEEEQDKIEKYDSGPFIGHTYLSNDRQ